MKRLRRKVATLLTGVLTVFSLTSGIMNQDINVKAAVNLITNPRVAEGITTWDTITFGRYPQSDATGAASEPIRWRVLSISGKDAFLLADQNVDALRFHDVMEDSVTWETSELRSWLNNTFYNKAFSTEEKNAILSTTCVTEDTHPYPLMNTGLTIEGGNHTVDKLFCPSIEEITNRNYGFVCLDTDGAYYATDTRVATNTAYTAAGGSSGYKMNGTGKVDGWWLRSMGATTYFGASVGKNGTVEYGYYNEDYSHIGVRPALHLNLENTSLWSAVGIVSAKHTYNPQTEQDTPPTLTPTTTAPVVTPVPVQGTTIVTSTIPEIVKAPAKVKLNKMKNGKGKKVVCSYKKVTGVAGYEVQYGTRKNFTKAKSKSTSKTSITLSGLKKGKTYYIRVRAYKVDGNKKVYGKWGQAKKVKVKR